MHFFQKVTAAVTDYLVLYGEVGAVIFERGVSFVKNRWKRFQAMLLYERIHISLTILIAFFTFLPWRAYTITFTDGPERRHGIYSDDFALVLIGCLLVILPLLWRLAPETPSTLKHTRYYRFAGLFLVVLLAFTNWVYPARIAATTEASFTWAFFVFQTLVFLWTITGVLGVKDYAQYPDKN
ncbi:MAG: hypothetical protein LDLANPLL_00491 [Turneriella sp.]|nr:hypothetical protein [Turneriella sp.]